MKKYTMLLCALLLCLLLAGCGESPSEPSDTPNTPDTQEQPWSYILTVREEKGEAKADDGRVVATYRYQVPEMKTEEGTPTAEEQARMDNFNDYFAGWLTNARLGEFEWLAEGAKEDYALMQGEDSLWEQSSYAYASETDTSFWDNGKLLCVSLHNYLFSGGVHGNGARSAELFDLATGRPVTWQDLVADEDGIKQAVAEEMLRQAQAMLEQGDSMLYDDYAGSLQNWTDREVFFGDDGMTVVYSAYEIAPYAAGDQAFTVPYEVIAPYLNDVGRELLGL